MGYETGWMVWYDAVWHGWYGMVWDRRTWGAVGDGAGWEMRRDGWYGMTRYGMGGTVWVVWYVMAIEWNGMAWHGT